MWMNKKLNTNAQTQQVRKHQNVPPSVMCYPTVAGGSMMSHHQTHGYLFLNFHKSAALLVCTKHNVGIQSNKLALDASCAPVPILLSPQIIQN